MGREINEARTLMAFFFSTLLCCEGTEAASSCLVYWFASRIKVCARVCGLVNHLSWLCRIYASVSLHLISFQFANMKTGGIPVALVRD